MAQLHIGRNVITLNRNRDGAVLDRRFVCGLDLGQANDYTALAIAEVVIPEDDDGEPDYSRWSLQFSHLERWRRVPYPDIVDVVSERMARLSELGTPVLVVDATGVGRPIVDLFRASRLGVTMWPVTIATSAMGQARRDPDGRGWTVPKRDLVGALQLLAFSNRLRVSANLPEARTLATELENFRMKYTAAANATYEAWRERDHDDLVLATALACWAGGRWFRGGGVI